MMNRFKRAGVTTKSIEEKGARKWTLDVWEFFETLWMRSQVDVNVGPMDVMSIKCGFREASLMLVVSLKLE